MAIIIEIIQKNCPNYPVWAFGSRTKQSARESSDLDLVIISTEKIAVKDIGNLKEAFSDSDLPFRVDVSDWSQLPDSFKPQIIKNKVVLYNPNGIANP